MERDQVNFKIYKPNQRHDEPILKSLLTIFNNVVRSKDLMWQLFKRDYFASYKKSFIGIAWVIVSPIIGIVSWLFLKKSGMFSPGNVGIPYPAYVLIGSSMWGLFLGVFNSTSMTLETAKDIILQVNFPREALLFKQAAIEATNFMISILINISILIIFGVKPSLYSLLLPLVAVPIVLLASSFGLVVSMISIVAFDMKQFITAVIGLLLYTTPIIYSNEISNKMVQLIIKWNPLTYLLCSARDIIIYGRLYDTTGFIICSTLSVLFFFIALRLFYVSENKIIERML